MSIKKILVPVDYSESSGAALRFAAGIANKLGAELDVVHVWDRPTYVADNVKVGHGEHARSLIDMIRDNAHAEMGEFIAKVKLPPQTKLAVRLLSGNPAGTILNELRRGEHEFLVVGTHGRTGLQHMLLGSVAEKLVRLAPVPVLTVPSERTP